MIETGIKFGNIHSFNDLNMILSKVEISPASPKTTYIDIPGGDGSIDLTEAHGEIRYSDRTIKIILSMLPSDSKTWAEKQTEISNALNGRYFDRITLEKDADFYYSGRCTVSDYAEDGKDRQISISAKVRPYKMRQNETVLKVNLSTAEHTITLQNSRKSVIPDIVCTGNAAIVFKGNTFTIGEGAFRFLDILLVEGANIMTVSGSGTLTFTYREGDL